MASQDLVTLAQVREALEYDASYTARDSWIGSCITRASDRIMEITEREFAPATASATRRFRVRPGVGEATWTPVSPSNMGTQARVSLAPYDLRSATTVTLHPETSNPQVLVANTDYSLWPQNPRGSVYRELILSRYVALSSQTQSSFGYCLIDVAGAWGFATVPTTVQEACIAIVSATLERRVALAAAAGEQDGVGPVFAGPLTIPRAVREELENWKRYPLGIPRV